MNIRPLNDKILIRRDKKDEKTPGGIIIPETADQKVNQGVVVAAGRGRVTDEGRLLETEVKVGQRVLFGHYSGQTVMLDGEELLVVREDDVLGVVED